MNVCERAVAAFEDCRSDYEASSARYGREDEGAWRLDVVYNDLATNPRLAQAYLDALDEERDWPYVAARIKWNKRKMETRPDGRNDVPDKSDALRRSVPRNEREGDDEAPIDPSELTPEDDRTDIARVADHVAAAMREKFDSITEAQARAADEVTVFLFDRGASIEAIVRAALEAIEAAQWIHDIDLGEDARESVPDITRFAYELREALGDDPPLLDVVAAHVQGVIEDRGDWRRCPCGEFVWPFRDSDGKFDKRVRTCRDHSRQDIANEKRRSA